MKTATLMSYVAEDIIRDGAGYRNMFMPGTVNERLADVLDREIMQLRNGGIFTTCIMMYDLQYVESDTKKNIDITLKHFEDMLGTTDIYTAWMMKRYSLPNPWNGLIPQDKRITQKIVLPKLVAVVCDLKDNGLLLASNEEFKVEDAAAYSYNANANYGVGGGAYGGKHGDHYGRGWEGY